MIEEKAQIIFQMLDLGKQYFCCDENAPADPDVVFADVHVVKRRTVHPAALLCRGGDLQKQPLVILQLFPRKAVVEGTFNIQHIGRIPVFEPDENALVYRNAQPALTVQRRHGRIERLTHLGDLRALFRKRRAVLLGGKGERIFKAFQKLCLIRFVGM